MKQYGFTGKGTGKLGSSIFAISGGEQIVRQYNPVVSNPKTEAQTEQRAKFKLMTQLAAAMSGQIAFRKSNLTSARNKFVAANIGKVDFAEDRAFNVLAEMTLTGGTIAFPGPVGQRPTATSISVALENAPAANVKRVVYVVYSSTYDDKIEFVEEKVVSDAGVSGTYETTFDVPNKNVIVFAYGVIDNSTKASIAFAEYEASADDNEAIVSVIKSLAVTDYTLTATRGTVVEKLD